LLLAKPNPSLSGGSFLYPLQVLDTLLKLKLPEVDMIL